MAEIELSNQPRAFQIFPASFGRQRTAQSSVEAFLVEQTSQVQIGEAGFSQGEARAPIEWPSRAGERQLPGAGVDLALGPDGALIQSHVEACPAELMLVDPAVLQVYFSAHQTGLEISSDRLERGGAGKAGRVWSGEKAPQIELAEAKFGYGHAAPWSAQSRPCLHIDFGVVQLGPGLELEPGRQRTDLQRESITLAYYNGYTYLEVAHQLDAKLPTVKARMRDGLIRLRDCLGTTKGGTP